MNLQHIPNAFGRTYFTQSKKDVILQDLDGKTWKVHLQVYENCTSHFNHGWKEFAVDHDLKVGDKCTFELLESGPEISLRVTISKGNNEDANDHLTLIIVIKICSVCRRECLVCVTK